MLTQLFQYELFVMIFFLLYLPVYLTLFSLVRVRYIHMFLIYVKNNLQISSIVWIAISTYLGYVCVLLIRDLVVIEITARLYRYRKECLAFCCVGLSIVDTTPSVCVGGGRNMVHNKWTIVLSMNGCPQKIYHLKTFKLSHKHF